jgi:hypothetical protein
MGLLKTVSQLRVGATCEATIASDCVTINEGCDEISEGAMTTAAIGRSTIGRPLGQVDYQ